MADDKGEPDQARRHFLKVTMAASAVLAAASVAALAKPLVNPSLSAQGPTSFPKVKVASLSSLVVGSPVTFNYPLDNEPNVLVKLGQKALNGVGPDGDIVAYSNICQHLGCLYDFLPKGGSPPCDKSYIADGPVGYCCCHGSIYDFTSAAKVVDGPAPRPLSMVILEVDSAGDVYATGMTPPAIYGHDTGSSDVTNDLEGGNLVS